MCLEESGSKKTGKKSHAGDPQSSPLLFSDVEQKVCDDFDAEDFLAGKLVYFCVRIEVELAAYLNK